MIKDDLAFLNRAETSRASRHCDFLLEYDQIAGVPTIWRNESIHRY